MTCRAPTSATTCAGGSPTGASLAYDAERRLTHWQNAPSNPTSQAWYLYDGAGQRVEQDVSGGSGNHTYYLPGGVEEVTPSGSLIKYYAAGGMALGLNTASDASGISYLASDGLGSVSEALSAGGTAAGAQLYSPYGGVRYSTGTMPTAKGFTGQYRDTASSGLDYYGARYYDPSLGQFTSADTVNDGINRYGYVKGNPETYTDPTGHMLWDGGNSAGGGSTWPDWSKQTNPSPRPLPDDNSPSHFYGPWWNRYYDSHFNGGGDFKDIKGRHEGPNDEYEVEDGGWLASYFRCHVNRIEAIQGDPDYQMWTEFDYDMPFVSPTHLESDKIGVDLYTPSAGTKWDNPDKGRDNGIVGRVWSKGKQASIVVVDLRLYDPTNSMSESDLEDLGARIVYHPYNGGQGSVARVIFINGADKGNEYRLDYNPTNYGPSIYPTSFQAPLLG